MRLGSQGITWGQSLAFMYSPALLSHVALTAGERRRSECSSRYEPWLSLLRNSSGWRRCVPYSIPIVEKTDETFGRSQNKRLVCGKCIPYTVNYRLGVDLCEISWVRKFHFCCPWLARPQEFPHSSCWSFSIPAFKVLVSCFVSSPKAIKGSPVSFFFIFRYLV